MPFFRRSRSPHPHKETLKYTKEGGLILSDKRAKTLGLEADTPVDAYAWQQRLEISANIHSLAKVYIEASSLCNLNCDKCVRTYWQEDCGHMSQVVFDALIAQLQEINTLQTVMFGGIGEPTLHPRLPEMIGRVKGLGAAVEITTNGTLLTDDMLRSLKEARLDTLWVSVETAMAEEVTPLMERLVRLKEMNQKAGHRVDLGLVFVADKNNVHLLKRLHHLTAKLDARRVMITNLIPYTREQQELSLCQESALEDVYSLVKKQAFVHIPRFDFLPEIQETLFTLLRYNQNNNLSQSYRLHENERRCPFVSDRSTFIRWDGSVCPCMALLHQHDTWTRDTRREIQAQVFGSLMDNTLDDIWQSEAYHSFRDRVHDFTFSPCHLCGGCSDLESNRQDCFGNEAPVCGACLWAYNSVRCP